MAVFIARVCGEGDGVGILEAMIRVTNRVPALLSLTTESTFYLFVYFCLSPVAGNIVLLPG